MIEGSRLASRTPGSSGTCLQIPTSPSRFAVAAVFGCVRGVSISVEAGTIEACSGMVLGT